MRAFRIAALLAVILVAPAALRAGEASAASSPPRPRAVIATSKGAITVELYPDEAPQAVATFLALADGKRAFVDPATGAEVTRPFYDGLTFHRVIAGFMIQGGCPKGDGSGGPGFSFADEFNAASLGLDRETVLLADGSINPQCGYMDQMIRQAVVMPRVQALGATPTQAQLAALDRELFAELRRMTLQQLYEKLGYRYDPKLPASHRPLRGSLAMANSGPNTNGSQFFINLEDTPHLTGKHTVFGAVVAGFEIAQAIGAVPVGAQSRPRDAVTIVSIRSATAP